MTDADSLTLTQADNLGQLVRAVEARAKLAYYPAGTDSDKPMSVVLRAFTHDGGGFWFDTDGDVRNAFVWTSGFMEIWLPVRELLAALDNLEGKRGLTEPIAIIEWSDDS